MNKLILPTLLLAMTSLLGCSKPADAPPSGKAQRTIGLSVLTLTNPFFKVIADTMIEEGKKHGYEVLVTSGDQEDLLRKRSNRSTPGLWLRNPMELQL